MKKTIRNYDEIQQLNPKELATLIDYISLGPVSKEFEGKRSFYTYINDYICSSKICCITGKECIARKQKPCPFSYKDKVHKWLISKSISRTKDVIE